MAGRSPLVATAEQEAELRALSRSDVRSEADRARAVLLTLQGWTSVQLAEAFGVTPDAVRHWRGWFADRGVDALRSTLAPGPSPARGERALAVASLLLASPWRTGSTGPCRACGPRSSGKRGLRSRQGA
jgi:transposase